MVVTVRIKRRGDFSKLARKITTAITGPTKVKVGFPAGSDGGVIDRAFYNEFGTAGSGKGFKTPKGGGFGGPVPERPFMRLSMRSAKAGLKPQMAKSAKSVLNGSSSMRAVLAKMGVYGQGEIKKTITSLSSPPNSPVTIALKGSSNPLIATGEMRQAVTWKIDE